MTPSTTDINFAKGNDDYGAWDGRGDAAYVSMWCENGCSWDVRFGFHKGSTFMGFENTRKTITDLGLILAGNDTEKLVNAYKTARSARFEFGQTPKIAVPTQGEK